MSSMQQSVTLCDSYAHWIECLNSPPLNLKPHHNPIFLLDLTNWGGLNYKLLTIHFQALMICTQNLNLGEDTCPLPIA